MASFDLDDPAKRVTEEVNELVYDTLTYNHCEGQFPSGEAFAAD